MRAQDQALVRSKRRATALNPSGGQLKVPKTDAERLVLAVKLRKLKSDYLRRNA